MKNDRNGKLSKAIENLKIDIRSFKKQGTEKQRFQ